ncbi:Kinesin light chain [Fusarium oxysporum f. sp. cubense]|uniref:Kinesin light chain n=1 Tax=Fusarium oxysporum f. sp. cubense TaxID=61366 RepID=A0A559LFD6_FUSOC|nr:Kinesin light chain [Fusarium oxysporum f. sp. cubense]
MAERVFSMTFGDGNRGVQVGQSNAPIQATFNLPPEPVEPTPPPFASIPFRRDPTFVDRGDILDQIGRQCSEPASRVAIVGLGGIGKSQLAIEFAHRVAAHSAKAWAFWVHASTQARVIEGFKSIADKVKLMGRNRPDADVLQLVFDWLSNVRNGKWLLVLDSADDSDVLLRSTSRGSDNGRKLVEYLPQSPNGSILITTRNRDLAFRLIGTSRDIHEIGPMTQEEALKLLKNRLGILSDANAAADLVRSLDLVPLAISQAAAYIQMRAPRTSLVQYLTEFRQSESKRAKLLSYDGGDLRRDLRQDGGASNAILTTWQVSFDHIRSRRSSAADLLSLMSFFNRQGIPESLIRPSKDSHIAAQSISPEDMTDSDSQGSDDEIGNDFESDIEILRDYCLIMQGEDASTFEMHGLVQLSMRRWLKDQGLQDKFLEQYITVMASSFPIGDYENWTVCRALFAHVETAVEYRPNEDNLRGVWSRLLQNGGRYAWLQGRYAVAEQMTFKAKRTCEKLLGKDHPDTLTSTNNLALIYHDQGRWEEAEKLQMQVIETFKAKLGGDHLDTLTSINNLASTYFKQGRWEEAEKLFMQVIETRKAKLGGDHPDTLISINNLASIYYDQGRWEKAEKLFMQVIETRKAQLGGDHPDTLISISNLALTYSDQARWEEAEKLQMQLIETRKAELGGDHPDTLRSIGILATTYYKQGRWEEAERLQVKVMETSKAKLGGDHPDTLTSIDNLASVYWKQGRWEEAEKLFMQVIETRKAKLGGDHLDTLISINSLASTYSDQGRWEEAEKLFMQVIETRKAKLGGDHPDTLISIGILAMTYYEQGRWEEAERLQVKVMETSKAKLGGDHPDTLMSIENLALIYSNQGRWEEAEKLQMQLIETRKAKLGGDHPDTLRSIGILAIIYCEQGRWEEAERLQVKLMETSKTKLGGDHPDTLTSISTLASIYYNQGRWEEAEKLQTQLIETRKAELGGDHPDTSGRHQG